MSSLFSSPSKQAGQSAQGLAGIANQFIGEAENYQNKNTGLQRGAMDALGPNPFFAAADQMSPKGYAVDPSYTASYGTAIPSPYGGGVGATSASVHGTAPALPAPVAPPPAPVPMPPPGPPPGPGGYHGPGNPPPGMIPDKKVR